MSIADITSRAECSVGPAYHHFKNKKALFFALFHRMTEKFATLNRQAIEPSCWDGANIHDLFSGYIDFMNRLREETAPTKTAVSLVVTDDPDLRAYRRAPT